MSERITIATFNVWALPFAIADHVSERVDAIAGRLGDLGADVVAFQEAWTGEVKQRLAEAGLDSGYTTAWYDSKGTSGGLLVLSRRPVAEVRFRRFLVRGLPQRLDQGEYYAGKGFIHLRLVTEKGPLTVVNTHLHAEYSSGQYSDYFGIQTAQIVQLAAYIAGLSEPVLAPGDFNVHEGNSPYRVLLGLGEFADSAVTLDHRQATARRSNPYRKGKAGPDSRVDYVLYRSGDERGVRPLSIERVFDEPLPADEGAAAYSDHDGLLAEFLLTDRPESRFHRPTSEILDLAVDLLEEGRAQAERRRRNKRLAAGACLAAGALPLSERFRSRLSRRRFLKSAKLALPALAWPAGAVLLTLSETFVPEELAAYDQLFGMLDKRWGRG